MTDAKDILGLSRTGSDMIPGSSEKRRNNKESHKKPDGVSREVYSLIGGLPSMMSSLEMNLKKHSQEPTDPDEKVGWRFLPFRSSARKDNLQLHHWERVILEKETPDESDTNEAEGSTSVAMGKKGEGSPNFQHRPKYRVVAGSPKDYTFAKYNQAVEIIRYTDEEYATYLEDAKWTRGETDKLFDLCEQFDLRFIVVADRFPTPRTVEELKDRYYSAAKVILERRASNQEEVVDHTLVKNVYDCEYEVHRKKTLGILLSQSRRQDRDDNELLDAAQSIREVRYKEKLARKERIAELKKNGKPLEVDKPEDSEADFCSRKTPTRPRRPSARIPGSQTSPSRLGTQMIAAKVESSEASDPFTAAEETPNVYASATTDYVLESKIPGVILRSQHHAKMVQDFSAQVGPRTARRINHMIEKHNCRPELKLFTKRVCALHLELRKELDKLLKLEESVQSSEAEIKTLETPRSLSPKASEKTSPSRSRRLQRGTGIVAATDVNASSGERVSKRERRRSVRIMEH